MSEPLPGDSQPTVVAGPGAQETPQPTQTPASPPTEEVAASAMRIPGYQVLEEIGRGGMGVVYKACQVPLNRVVALKVMRTSPRARLDGVRFHREAELAARLIHPHIVQVFDHGTYTHEDGEERSYIAFEYISGTSLERQLRDFAQSVPHAARLVATLARTMHLVHQTGVIHRDLKPANILLQPDPEGGGDAWRPKISDFGLACLLQDDDSALTRTGQLLGTPRYMAPEQAEGQRDRIGPATDIHALGAILYESLTGRPPFQGSNLHETLELVRTADPVAVRRIRPEVPRDLETICLKCLQKDPSRRYGTGADLADDLDRFLDGRPIRARRISPVGRAWRWCRRQPGQATLVGVCLVLFGLMIAGSLWYTNRLATARGEALAARVEADATRVVVATQRFHARLRAIRDRASQGQPGWTATGLADLRAALDIPVRNVDRQELRALAIQCLSQVDLSSPRRLSPGFTASRLAFHPYRRLMAVGQAKAWIQGTVVLMDVDSGTVVRRLTFTPISLWQGAQSVQDGVRALCFAGEGRFLVVGTRAGRLHFWDLDLPNGAPVTLAAHRKEVRDLVASPDGKAVFSSSADGTLGRWALGPSPRRTHQAALSGMLCLAPGGNQLLVAEGSDLRALALADLEPIGRYSQLPATRVAGARHGPAAVGYGRSVWLFDAELGRPTRKLYFPGLHTTHQGDVTDFRFCPHGCLLITLSSRPAHACVWEVSSGRLLYRMVLSEPPIRVGFSGDGRTLGVLTERAVHLYRIEPSKVREVVALQPSTVQAAVLLDHGQEVATLAGDRKETDGVVGVWPTTPGAAPRWRLRTQVPPVHLPMRLAASPSFNRLAWTDAHGGICTTERAHRGSVPVVVGSRVQALAFGTDARLWDAASQEVHLRDIRSLTLQRSWSNALSDVFTGKGVVWSVAAGRSAVLAGGRDGLLRLLDPETARLHNSWKLSTAGLTALALAPGEHQAVVGAANGEVFLVDLPSGHIRAHQHLSRESIGAVTFVTRTLVASGSGDGCVQLWQVNPAGLEPWVVLENVTAVQSLSSTSDGNLLAVTRIGERGVRLWHLDRLRQRLAGLGLE